MDSTRWLKFSEATATGIVDVLKKALAPRDARITALEEKLARLDTTSIKFCGVWREGGSYGPGDAAIRHGGLWICRHATASAPGKSDAWQLAVKSGSVRDDA
jgi:hypothetical protein